MLSKPKSIAPRRHRGESVSLWGIFVESYDWWSYIDGHRVTAHLSVNRIDSHLIITCRYGKYECSLDDYTKFEGNMDDFVRHHVLALKARR